ncbi:hypothetical protein CDAR_222791 [Caerostris darwini]|uniref:Uncharacterized protein n=1 Tax=Caerostris darwini TaxID=1538125 RepID=A0AAV4NGB1_9ARAC|nr:hypothetical protein CDAR_222791 [Caerostris darwini]
MSLEQLHCWLCNVQRSVVFHEKGSFQTCTLYKFWNDQVVQKTLITLTTDSAEPWQTSDHGFLSYPLVIGISLKLLGHNRCSCKRASQAKHDYLLRDSRQVAQMQFEENPKYTKCTLFIPNAM